MNGRKACPLGKCESLVRLTNSKKFCVFFLEGWECKLLARLRSTKDIGAPCWVSREPTAIWSSRNILREVRARHQAETICWCFIFATKSLLTALLLGFPGSAILAWDPKMPIGEKEGLPSKTRTAGGWY